MAKIGAVVVQMAEPPREVRAFVLDGIRTTDRPAAIGYFLLSIMREWNARLGRFPVVNLRIGMVEAADLSGVDTRTTMLHDDWFGRIYELTVAAERNDPGILGR